MADLSPHSPDELDLYITALTAGLATMTGINQAPEHPPDSLEDCPMVVCHIVETDTTRSPTITCLIYGDVLLDRNSLPVVEAAARPYILLGTEYFLGHVTQDGTCAQQDLFHIDGPGPITWAGKDHFGVRYHIKTKFHVNRLSISP